MKNTDKFVILEDKNNFDSNALEVNELIKEFTNELAPIGLACCNWGKQGIAKEEEL